MKYQNFGGYPYARKLAVGCAKAAALFPPYEQFALAQQLRRAAYSVVLNIAEAFSRKGAPSLKHYLDVAFTSANEVEVILDLSEDLGYIDDSTLVELRDYEKNAARLIISYKRSIADPRHPRPKAPQRNS